MKKISILKPDSKGRITLGKLAAGITSFRVLQDSHEGNIILEPYTEIPLKERWLYNNKMVLKQLSQGIEDSAQGKISSKGDFSKY